MDIVIVSKMEATRHHHILDGVCIPSCHLLDPTLFLFLYMFPHNVYNLHAFLNLDPV